MIDRTNMTIDAYLRQAGIASKIPNRSKTFIPLKQTEPFQFTEHLQAARSIKKSPTSDSQRGTTISDYLSACTGVSTMPAPYNPVSRHDRVFNNIVQSPGQHDRSRLSFLEQAASQNDIDHDTMSKNVDRNVKSNLDSCIHQSIRNAANKYKLPDELIRSVIQAESNFQPEAVSSAGAQGLMQLMPATAKELGVEDPFDIAQNIDGGARYIKQMLDRFNGDIELALAAYNAGPGTVERYNGNVPYPETRNYVQRVLSNMNGKDRSVS